MNDLIIIYNNEEYRIGELKDLFGECSIDVNFFEPLAHLLRDIIGEMLDNDENQATIALELV